MNEHIPAAIRPGYTPVFIGGAPRSGTTMLSALVSTSESCNAFAPEFHYLGLIGQALLATLSTYDKTQKPFFRDQATLLRNHFGFVRQVLDEAWLALGRPSRLVIKHCKLTPLFGLLARHIPDALFLVICRDPRDIVASRLRAEGKRGRPITGPRDNRVEEYVAEFNAYYGSVFAAADSDLKGRFLALQLEEVSSGSLDALSSFLGLTDIAPERLWSRSVIDIREYRASHLFSRHWGEPLTSQAAHTYRDVLDAETADRIYWATKGVTTGFAALARESQSMANRGSGTDAGARCSSAAGGSAAQKQEW
jgi:hypothetical protein